MKNFTKVLTGVTMVFVLFGAYIIFGPRLSIVDIQRSDVPATERLEAFQTIVAGIARGDFGANQFAQMESVKPEDYTVSTYVVTVRNLSVLKAEWAQVNISPLSEDVVLIAGEPLDIWPFGSAELAISVLSTAGETGERPLWVDYYLFGYKENAAQ